MRIYEILEDQDPKISRRSFLKRAALGGLYFVLIGYFGIVSYSYIKRTILDLIEKYDDKSKPYYLVTVVKLKGGEIYRSKQAYDHNECAGRRYQMRKKFDSREVDFYCINRHILPELVANLKTLGQ